MIFDHIDNLSRYDIPKADDITAYVKMNDLLQVPVGEIEIRGRELFVRPMEYETKTPSEGKFETHRVYADLQLVVSGVEVMQMALPDALAPLTDYDEAKDCRFFKAGQQITDITVPDKYFAFFYPGEAHRPCCHSGGKPGRVKKLVFKIKIK